MKNSLQKIPFVFSIIFLLVACFAFVFLFNQIGKQNNIAEEKMQEWEAENARREEIKSLDESLKSVEAGRKELESHFAQSSDIVPFLDTMEELARSVSASPEIISVDDKKEANTLLLNMRAKGSFESLYKFITLLENAPYKLEFTSMHLAKPLPEPGGGSSAWEATFTLKLLTYIK
jgi:hypothetical protein